MAYKLVTPGTYDATVANWGVVQKDGKQPRIFITFAITDNGEARTIDYRGGITGDGFKYTLEALSVCGFNGSDLAGLAQGKEGGALKAGQLVEIVVNHRPSQDGAKTFDNVKFVNRKGGAKFQGLMDATTAKAALGTDEIKAQILAFREAKGMPEAPKPAVAAWDEIA